MENILEHLKNVFGDAVTGRRWAAIGATAALGAVGGLAGSAFGGGLMNIILGAVIGLFGGTVLGNKINEFGSQLGIGNEKPSVPSRGLAPRAHNDVVVSHKFEIEQPGGRAETITAPIPKKEYFANISETGKPLAEEINAQRKQIDLIKPDGGEQQIGAMRALLAKEARATQVVADSQKWDETAKAWTAPGGGREKLIQSLETANMTFAGTGEKPFDLRAVPVPPVFNAKLPELPENLERYAVNMLSASGNGATAAEFRQKFPNPQERLHFVAKNVDEELKKNPLPELGFKERGIFNPKIYTEAVADAYNGERDVNFVVTPKRSFISTASEDAYKANIKDYIDSGDLKTARKYADKAIADYKEKANEELSADKKERWTKDIALFEKIAGHLEAREKKQQVDALFDQVNLAADSIQKTAAAQIPAYLKQVADLQEQSVHANQRMGLQQALNKSAPLQKRDDYEQGVEGFVGNVPTPAVPKPILAKTDSKTKTGSQLGQN